jgi:hypothetical protein
MKLITEEISKVEFVVEGTGSKKKMFIEGVFLQGDIKNRNGRMYPMSTLEKEVGRYNEAFVSKGRALGELGHPDGPTVNLDRVSHKIVSLTKEGSNFRGKAQILDTPMGKIAKSLIDEGVMLGVSSRGVGSLRTTNEGHKVVGEDFMLATAADIVADPSAPLSQELWKEKSGFGTVEFSVNNSQKRQRKELTLLLIKIDLRSISSSYGTISYQIFNL